MPCPIGLAERGVSALCHALCHAFNLYFYWVLSVSWATLGEATRNQQEAFALLGGAVQAGSQLGIACCAAPLLYSFPLAPLT